MSNTKILLHVCCGPCMIYPLKKLREQGFAISAFFYNPNIYPATEYKQRMQTVTDYAGRVHCQTTFAPSYNPGEFSDAIAGNYGRPQRCQACWYLRLKKTAQQAQKQGIGMFTTTLLVSPYQDKQLLNQAGEKAAVESGIRFYFYDFSEGYRESVRISKEEQMYRQKYCGCKFSIDERGRSKRVAL